MKGSDEGSEVQGEGEEEGSKAKLHPKAEAS